MEELRGSRTLQQFLQRFQMSAGVAEGFFGQGAGGGIEFEIGDALLDGGDILLLIVDHLADQIIQRQIVRIGKAHRKVAEIQQLAALQKQITMRPQYMR